ncbi:MAG: hypothetical protein JWQ87_2660, partial [Candidatus Sulfotelmatobacter sp.]|nr:hypothetical protein [Candidatus Sulfotelmatobacter sp.]
MAQKRKYYQSMAEKIDKGVSPREVLLDAGYSP